MIDLKHGYHQMPLAEESRACTAMSTPLGPLQWKVMPMGVTNGNAAFQRMLENLLEPVRDCADPFMDDVIIASGDPSMSYEELLEAHERDVTRVLDLLVRHKLTGSSDKATIAVSEVVFAGHVVGNGQRKPIPGKVAAIEHWEKPKTVSELRAYLGFCNYYSGYIKMYAEYAAPMTTMLKGHREETKKGSKKALVWDAESDRAFEGMKQALLSAVCLHLVDPDREFVLRTDASDYAVGAVLEQVLDDGRHVPVAFWSRVLAEGQRRTWTPREKEAYAIVMALRKWAGYIALHPVTVCTDHQSLQSWHKEHVDTPSGSASRRARWHETLAKFDLTVVYIREDPGPASERLGTRRPGVQGLLARLWAVPRHLATRLLVRTAGQYSLHGVHPQAQDQDPCLGLGSTHPGDCSQGCLISALGSPLMQFERLCGRRIVPHLLALFHLSVTCHQSGHISPPAKSRGGWPLSSTSISHFPPC